MSSRRAICCYHLYLSIFVNQRLMYCYVPCVSSNDSKGPGFFDRTQLGQEESEDIPLSVKSHRCAPPVTPAGQLMASAHGPGMWSIPRPSKHPSLPVLRYVAYQFIQPPSSR